MTDVSEFLEENAIIEQEVFPRTPAEKYMLDIKEAAAYFNIGRGKIRKLASENLGTFGVLAGNRFLIIREKFEEYLQNTDVV